MLLENSLYNNIYFYLKEINDLLETNNLFSSQYKTYDKSNGDYINFIFFDIKSFIKTENDVILKEIKYEGFLKISYFKPTNEVCVLEVPNLVLGDLKIPIFTSDLASIITKAMNKYIPNEDIKLTFFNKLLIMAIDDKVKNIIPSVVNCKNYYLVKNILEIISKEINKITRDSERYKAKKEREYRAQERAVAKKRKIFGLDPISFSDETEFKTVLEEKVINMCSKKIANLNRHFEANKLKYIELLKKFNLEYIEDNSPNNNEDYFDLSIDDKLNCWFDFDMNDKRGAHSILKAAVDDDTYSKYEFDAPYDTCNIWGKIDWYLGKINYQHPIFIEDNCFNNDYSYNKDFISAFELLFNIDGLLRQIKYYNTILNNPSSYVLNFNPTSSWGAIMTYPYWIRLGRDHYTSDGPNRDKYYLLMINPGVKKIDLDNLKCFVSFNDKSYTKTNSLLYSYEEIMQSKKFNCTRMIVTIPASLDYNEINKLIMFAINNAIHINFICENADIAVLVKRIIILNELNALEKGWDFIKGNYYVNVDPNYYNFFFTNTPDNKEYWHKYDNSSDYKFRRKDFFDLKSLIMYHIKMKCPNFPKLKDNYFMAPELLELNEIMRNSKLRGYDRDFLNEEQNRIYKEKLKEACSEYLKPIRKELEDELLGTYHSMDNVFVPDYKDIDFCFHYYNMNKRYSLHSKPEFLSEEEINERQMRLKRIKENLTEDYPF